MHQPAERRASPLSHLEARLGAGISAGLLFVLFEVIVAGVMQGVGAALMLASRRIPCSEHTDSWTVTVTRDLQTFAEVVLAMLLGGVIGLEREAANKPAGFRTHMLVAGAAAFLVALGVSLVDQFVLHTADRVISADPIRVVQAVIIGVSFLGTGTIFRARRGDDVHGLTTAASLLMSSAIGIAVALRHTVLAVAVATLTTLVLRLIGRIEGRMARRNDRSDS